MDRGGYWLLRLSLLLLHLFNEQQRGGGHGVIERSVPSAVHHGQDVGFQLF
jgi:hypothetical protein